MSSPRRASHHSILSAAGAALLALGATAADEPVGHLMAPAGAFVSVHELTGISLEAVGAFENRELVRDADSAAFDSRRWGAQVGYALLPWLEGRASAGAAQASLRHEADGDFGFAWALGLRATALEYAINRSPVLGNSESIRLGGAIEFVNAASDAEGDDLTWTELNFSGLLTYAVAYKPEDYDDPFEVKALALNTGFISSDLDADVNGRSFDEDATFGGLAGLELLFTHDVVASAEAHVFAGHDVAVQVTVGYRF